MSQAGKRMTMDIIVEVLSPLHLGSGQADVTVDADVAHDELGMPFFPGKRFRGLLYESGLEVVEMAELAGFPFPTRERLDRLFGRGVLSDTGLRVPDLHLRCGDELEKAPENGDEYDRMREEWSYLQQTYGEYFQPADVLEEYTFLRYQTRLEDGVAKDGSLRNMRVVKKDVAFGGSLELLSAEREDLLLLVLALENLGAAGGNRNRGMGSIRCRLRDRKEHDRMVQSAVKEGMGWNG